MNLSEQIKKVLIDVPDFPKPGILFKDITPLFKDCHLSKALIAEAAELIKSTNAEVIVGSRRDDSSRENVGAMAKDQSRIGNRDFIWVEY
jgi:hypothetical protein